MRTSLGQLHDLGTTDFFFFFVYLTFIDYPYDYHHFLLLLASLIPEVQVLFSSSVSRKARGVIKAWASHLLFIDAPSPEKRGRKSDWKIKVLVVRLFFFE